MMVLSEQTRGMPLRELLHGFSSAETSLAVTGVSLDSRRVKAGELFLACPGEQGNGADYIQEAVAAGAVAVAVDAALSGKSHTRPTVPLFPVKALRFQAGRISARFYGHPSRAMKVIGITGTNGKTSVAHMTARALAAYKEKETGVIGTLGHGLLGALRPGANTTPDAVTIQRLLAAWQGRAIENVAMEVSSHALAQGRVAGVDFSIGVFTNLSRDHLDYHGDMESYAQAKRRLFASERMKFAVVNADDQYGRQLQEELQPSLPVIPYGIVAEFPPAPAAVAVQAVICENSPDRLALQVQSPWGRGLLNSTLNGRFNAYNLVASLAVLCLLDVPFEQALAQLSRFTGIPGRLEYFGSVGGPAIFVDYAHTPEALKQALSALREQGHAQITCVFGCGGERDAGKRAEMGRIAEQHADALVLTSDNPRNEKPQAIIDDILAGIAAPDTVKVELDRAAAIRATLLNAAKTDTILIAGKGHETYQEIGGKRFPFSDRQLVRNLLQERP